MNCGFIYMAISMASLIVNILILMEFKVANNKQECKFTEKHLRSLVDKIDKVLTHDKIGNS